MSYFDKLIKSFNYAIEGVIYTLRTQKNMRVHFLAAIVVLIVALFQNFSKIEFVILLATITTVIVAEMINTSVEAVVDMITKEYHPLAKIAKDVAAGAVFITAMNALIVAYLLFFKNLNDSSKWIYLKVQQSPIHITFIAILLILILTVIGKTITQTGTPLKGGFISGHASLSFGIATAISCLTSNVFISTLAYSLAVLVAQSRIEGKIHKPFEVVMGAILGILVMIFIFQLRVF